VWKVGAAKADITYFEPGIGLLGWGSSRHVAYTVESSLYARAFVFETETEGPYFWIEVDLCMATVAVYQEVYRRLFSAFPNLQMGHLLITANHTHAAPAGYSYHLLYHINTPGFHRGVFEKIVSGIVEAAHKAYQNRQPAQLFYAEEAFPPHVPIAFNRAMPAFLKNKGIDPKLSDHPELAVDRTAYQITIHPTGHLINWFGTHTTTIQEMNLCISSDHKGYASELCENGHQRIAAFAQTTAGDVTPNNHAFPGLRVRRGPTPNPFENRRLIGQYQADMAQRLAQKGEPLPPILRNWHTWVDFSRVAVEEPYTRGRGRGQTGYGAIGPAMIGGTAEGGGVPPEAVRLISLLARLRGLIDPAIHGNKPILIDTVSKRIFGTRRWESLPLPPTDPAIRYLQWIARQRSKYVPFPLIPQILPVSIWQIGSVGLITLPFEPTTMAGHLIKDRLKPLITPLGIQHLIVQGYTNGYAGYLTTYEEYQYQRYEGGHTPFGKFQLAAVEKVLSELLTGTWKGVPAPPHLPPDEAEKVLFTYEVARRLR
jgi:neutral ceramidase